MNTMMIPVGRAWRAACALACLLSVVGTAHAVENKVVQWRFDNLPFWELADRGGAFGGFHASGRFEIVVEGDSISVRDAVFNLFPSGPISAAATKTGFSISYTEGDCYASGELCGSWGIEVEGDLTQRADTLPVVGGGFNFVNGHYEWWYGNFARDAASFVTQVSYVTNVPEPMPAATLALGLGLLAAMGALRSRRG
jgi:hypothetical protein